MGNKRIIYLDIIKAFAMFLVLFYHFGQLDYHFVKGEHYIPNINYWANLLTAIGVPLFFMTTGALLLNKKFIWNKHLHRLMKIFILFTLWKIITVFILVGKLNTDGYNFIDYVNLLFTNQFPEVPLNHLWFIYALLTIYLIFPALKHIYDNNKTVLNYLLIVIFSFSFILGTLAFIYKIFHLHFGVDSINIMFLSHSQPFGKYSFALFYFLIGGVIASGDSRFIEKIKTPLLIVIFIFGWSTLVFRGVIYTDIDDKLFTGVFSGYTAIPTVLIAFSLFCLIRKIKINNPFSIKVVTAISDNTLGIYFIHWIIAYLLIDEFYKYFPAEYLWVNLLKAILLLIASLTVALVIKRIPLLKKLLEM